jgi:hypothetical protein
LIKRVESKRFGFGPVEIIGMPRASTKALELNLHSQSYEVPMNKLMVTIILLPISLTVFAAEKKMQYFSGNIQVSSVDGKIPYGSSYPSISRRIVDFEGGSVNECVFQKGKLFITVMTRTGNPLIFTANDSEGSFKGVLMFGDESLSSWSYDIEVFAPNKGKITGKLPDKGAKIDEAAGTMTIKKVFNNQVLISEEYKSISKEDYENAIKQVSLEGPVPEICQ